MRAVIALLAALTASVALRPLPACAEECLDCHDLAAISPGGTVVHEPFGEKDCASCHKDHGDQERLVLVAEGNALCASCHEFTEAPFLAAHRKIAPTGKASCTGCHDPHRSVNRRLLRAGLHKPVKENKCESCHRSDGKLKIPMHQGFCHLCHDRKPFARPVVHEPVAKGRCADCHDPHGSGHRALLPAGYTTEREGTALEADAALCLRCHPAEAFRGDGGGKTRFVDATEGNLHARHIQPVREKSERLAERKGHTCRNCHETHAAPNAGLTRTELECGSSLCLKLEYRRAEAGGECLASCHGERVRYRRPAGAPAPPAQPPQP